MFCHYKSCRDEYPGKVLLTYLWDILQNGTAGSKSEAYVSLPNKVLLISAVQKRERTFDEAKNKLVRNKIL